MAAIVINIAGSYDDKAIGQAQRDLDRLKREGDLASAGLAGAFTRAGDKLKSIGASVSAAGMTMVKGITLPVVGVGIAAAVAFDKVDEGLDTVAAKSGFTGSKLEGLGQVFKNVAGNATQGMDEVGNSVGLLAGKLNLTGKPLETLATQVLDFARVTGSDAATATESVATALTAFGLKASEATPLLDSLVAASQRSGVSATDLATQLATVAPQFQTYGLGVEESVGLLTAFGKAGIPATKMATGLNTAFKNLREQGVKDLPAGLRDVVEQIKNAKDPTKATAIAVETFGSRVGVTLAEAIRSGKVSLADLEKGLKGSKGALDEAKAATEGPQEQFARLKNQAMLLGAQIAELALPIVEKLVPAVQSVIDWFKSLSPETKQLIVIIAAIAAAIGPLLVVMGSLITAVGALSGALGFLIANPIVLAIVAIVAAIAGLVIGIKYAYENFEGFRNFVDTVWSGIQAVVGYVVDWFMQYVWPILDEIFGYIKTALGVLWQAYAAYWGFIWQIVQKVVAWFMEYVWPTLSQVFALIGESLGVLWEAYKAYWTFIWNILKAVIDWFVANVWPKIQAAFSAIGTALGVLWNAYKTYWTFIWNILKDVINWITGTLWPGIQSAWENIKGAVQSLWDKFETAFKAIKSVVEANINAVKTILSGISSVVGTVIGYFDSIRQGIVEKFNAAVTFVSGIPGKILAALGSVATTLWSAGSDLIGGLIEGIKARAGEVLSTIASFITDKIPGWVKDRLGISSPSKVMMDIGQWIPAGLAAGIEKAADRVKEAARKLAEATTAEAKKAAKDALEEARKAAAELARRTADTIRDSAITGLDRVKEKAREVLDYVRGVRDDIRAFGGVMGTDFDKGTLTSGGIIASMRDRLATAQNFAGALSQLRQLGLNKTSLQEILKAGPGSGLEIAQALASGGPSAVAEVNALEAMLAQTGTAIGDIGASSQFGMTSGRAQGIVDTAVTVQSGAIVLNFGAGTSLEDQAAIRAAVEEAVRQGLRELAREIRAS